MKVAISVGTRVRAISGVPINALGPHYLYGPNESFLLPRGVLGRTESSTASIFMSDTGAQLVEDDRGRALRGRVQRLQQPGDVQRRRDVHPVRSTAACNPISGGSYEDLIWAKTTDNNGKETSTPTPRNPNFGQPSRATRRRLRRSASA